MLVCDRCATKAQNKQDHGIDLKIVKRSMTVMSFQSKIDVFKEPDLCDPCYDVLKDQLKKAYELIMSKELELK